MPLEKQRQPLSRRRPLHCVAPDIHGQESQVAFIGAFLSGLAIRRHTLAVAAIQASIRSPDCPDAAQARAENLRSMLSLLNKVQSYGGHKDICLFPVVPLPDDALSVLLGGPPSQLHAGLRQRGLARNGATLRRTTTIPPNGDIRIDPRIDRRCRGLKIADAVTASIEPSPAADAWYPGQAGLTTAIHSPDGRAIVRHALAR